MDTSRSSTVVGIFDDYPSAERAARELEQNGIPRESIDVRSNHMTGAAGRSYTQESTHESEGGISGFFHRLFGGDDDEYRGHYSEALRRGSAIVSVTTTQAEADRVSDILNQLGAVDIDDHVNRFREGGYESHDPQAAAYTYEEATRERERSGDRERATMPVVEEELQVGKRVVRRGGVRVYSHVIDQPVEEQVTLREEHARVERRPVNREVDPADFANMRDQSIEVTETVEEPVVRKRARVKEEVTVGKEVTERTERIKDTVRRTEVRVDDLKDTGDRQREEYAGDYTNDFDDDFRRDYETNYASSGVAYNDVRPAYDYGYRMAGNDRYRGRQWSDVESELRTDYQRNNPNSTWDNVKGAVRYGWEKVTGRR